MAATAYDRVSYATQPARFTRPEHLELMGTIFRMDPPPTPAPQARVLEIGCGSGGNLLALAEAFPDARFVGVDIAATQIARGHALVEESGVRNVDLRHADLATLDDSDGEFDYIIAHGLYSWLPPDVSDGLVRAIGARLTPNGIAFLSHNVKPGWYTKAMVGGMMRYATRHLAGDERVHERVDAGRDFLQFLSQNTRRAEEEYRATVAARLLILKEVPHEIVWHDDMGEHCEASWFHEVAAHLERHGLKFLSDSRLDTMRPVGVPEMASMILAHVAKDVIDYEQYLDFFHNRTYRMTLVCRASVTLDRRLTPDRIDGLLVSSRAVPADASADPRSGESVAYETTRLRANISDPLMKEALAKLAAAWPKCVAVHELSDRPELLRAGVFEGVLAGWIELALRPPPFTTEIEPRPRATMMSRIMARQNQFVPNLRHEILDVHELDRILIALCDGTRDHATLAAESGLPAEVVSLVLQTFAKHALLMPSR